MPSSKNCRPTTILTSSGATPLVVSPITVAGSQKGTGKASQDQQNWMRQQWVANLKKLTEKKRLAAQEANGQIDEEQVEESNGGQRTTWVKRLLKKRTNNHHDEPSSGSKPHTPRRKLNCGNAFEDIDSLSPTIDVETGGNNHTFVGIDSPSNAPAMSPSTRSWWSHLLPAEGEEEDHGTETDTSSNQQSPSFEFEFLATETKAQERRTSPPKLIRTSSVEQEGLSEYFEHTHIDKANPETRDGLEFRALVDDCKFTDIDEELDSFYLENLQCFDDTLELETLTRQLS